MENYDERYYQSLAEGLCPNCGAELVNEGGCSMYPEEEMLEFIRNDVFLKRQFAL